MSEFKQVFPELKSAPPTMMGNIPLPEAKVTALRRQQLVDLARAFDIEIPPGATKNQMLPSLINAEQQGVFLGQAKNPWYLQKAGRTSDIRYVDIGENPELAVTITMELESKPVVTSSPPVQAVDPNAPRRTRTGRTETDYHRKQRLLKGQGVNAFGWTKQAVNEAAAEHGIV